MIDRVRGWNSGPHGVFGLPGAVFMGSAVGDMIGSPWAGYGITLAMGAGHLIEGPPGSRTFRNTKTNRFWLGAGAAHLLGGADAGTSAAVGVGAVGLGWAASALSGGSALKAAGVMGAVGLTAAAGLGVAAGAYYADDIAGGARDTFLGATLPGATALGTAAGLAAWKVPAARKAMGRFLGAADLRSIGLGRQYLSSMGALRGLGALAAGGTALGYAAQADSDTVAAGLGMAGLGLGAAAAASGAGGIHKAVKPGLLGRALLQSPMKTIVGASLALAAIPAVLGMGDREQQMQYDQYGPIGADPNYLNAGNAALAAHYAGSSYSRW